MFEETNLNIAKIKVIGVGGGGNNAVNRMIEMGISSSEYVSVNTDKQALMLSLCDPENRIQIGETATKGLGAGADPSIGEKAAEESKAMIEKVVEGVDLLFIAAGMGGGTGTGASPVIAKIAKEKGCLTVAVVTKPFSFEGKTREENSRKGIANLIKYVDTIIIIPNNKLLEALPHDIPITEALKYADDTLRQGICGIADLIATPSMINLDFADVRTIIKSQGLAHMGVGRAKGENRIVEAVRQAVSSPLLETTIEGASGVILNVTGGNDISMGQVNEAAKLVGQVVDSSANIIFGLNINPELNEEVIITLIATGFDKTNDQNSVSDEEVEPQSAFPMMNQNSSFETRSDFGNQPNSFANNFSNEQTIQSQQPQSRVYNPYQEQQNSGYMNVRQTAVNDFDQPRQPQFNQEWQNQEVSQESIQRQEINQVPPQVHKEFLDEENNVEEKKESKLPSFVKRLFNRK